jgi:hypothetical protein
MPEPPGNWQYCAETAKTASILTIHIKFWQNYNILAEYAVFWQNLTDIDNTQRVLAF